MRNYVLSAVAARWLADGQRGCCLRTSGTVLRQHPRRPPARYAVFCPSRLV